MLKIALSILGSLLITLASVYSTYRYTSFKLHKAEQLSQKRENTIQKLRTQYAVLKATQEQSDALCEAKLKLATVSIKVRQKTVTELKQKIQKGKDYEILASDKPINHRTKCGCYFNGTGWVFQ